MERIGIRELRKNLASAVRRAGVGPGSVITIDGRPVARLVPLGPDESEVTLVELAQRGEVILAAEPARPDPGPGIELRSGMRVDRLIREVRGR